MVDISSVFNQLQGILQTLIFGPRNFVFFAVVAGAALGGYALKRGFRKKVKVVEQSPEAQTAEEYLSEHGQAQPKGGEEADQEKAPQTSSSPTTSDPELTRRLDAIEEALMRLSAKSDKTAIEPLLRLPERRIPVEISGTIDGDFEIPISALRNVRIAVKQVKEEREIAASPPAETPPTEGD